MPVIDQDIKEENPFIGLGEKQEEKEENPFIGLGEARKDKDKAALETLYPPEEIKNVEARMGNAAAFSNLLGVSRETAIEFHDDIKKELYMENIPDTTLWERVKESWRIGESNRDLGLLYFQSLMGNDSDENWKVIKDIEANMPGPDKIKRNIPERALRFAAENIPIMYSGIKRGATLGTAAGSTAAGVAALAGQAGPQAALPEEIITVPSAFAGAFTLGFKFGTVENIGKIEAGLAFKEFMEFQDEKGNRINPNLAKATAFGVGVINGLLELAQIKTLLKTVPGADKIVGGSIRNVTKKVVTSRFLREVLLKNSAQYAGVVGKETLQEVAQESTNIIFGELTKEINNQLKKTNIPRAKADEIINRLKEVAVESALGFGLMALPGTTATAVSDTAQVAEQKKTEQTAVKEEAVKEEEAKGPPITKEPETRTSPEVIKQEQETKVTPGLKKEIIEKQVKKEKAETTQKPKPTDEVTKTKEEIVSSVEQDVKDTDLQITREDIEKELDNVVLPTEEEKKAFLQKESGSQEYAVKKAKKIAAEAAQRFETTIKQKKSDIKKRIRELTGQTKVKELFAEKDILRASIKKAEQASRKAISEGKKEGIAKAKANYLQLKIKEKLRTQQRKRINKIIKDLKNIDTKHMSPEQAEPINELIAGIDLKNPTKKTEARLTATREYLQNNPEAELPSYILNDLIRLDKKPIRDMTVDDIDSLHKAVMHHVYLEKKKKEIKAGRRRRTREQLVEDSINEMKPAKKVETDLIDFPKIGKTAEKQKGRITLKNVFGVGSAHEHYDLIIESLAGQNSTMYKVLYDEVKEGINKQLKYRQDTFKRFQKFIEGFTSKYKIKDIANWLNEEVKTGKFNFTKGERMALYRHSLNEDNLEAILEGGIGRKPKDIVIKITEEELNTILESLDSAEKEFAGSQVDELFDNQYEELNRVFQEKNGYPLEKVENYYPKEVMPLERSDKDFVSEEAIEQFKGRWLRIGVAKGMVKERVGSVKPIFLNSIAFDINKSVMRSAAYIGLEIPLNNASNLIYDKTFRKQMNDRYSPLIWKEVEQGLRDIAGEHMSYSELERLMIKAKNRVATAMLGLNPFVMAKQIMSFPLYLVYVKPQYVVRGMIDYIFDPKGIVERHFIYSPEFLERVEGGFSRDVADVFKAQAEKRLYKGKEKRSERLMKGIKLFDKNAVAPGMQGAILQVLDEFRAGKLSREVGLALDIKDSDITSLSATDKMKLAYKYADYATERTQPMFSPEHRSHVSKVSSRGLQFFSMFGSFTNQALNLTMRSYREAVRTGDPAAYAKFSKALFLIFIVNTLGVVAIDELRDLILARKNKSSFIAKILSSWAGYLFFVRDVASSVISKVEKGTWLGYDVEIPIQRIPNLLANTIANGVGTITPNITARKRERLTKRFIDKGLECLLMFHGIPYKTPKQLVLAGLQAVDKIAREIE